MDIIERLRKGEERLKPIVETYDKLYYPKPNDWMDSWTNFIYDSKLKTPKDLISEADMQLRRHQCYLELKEYSVARWFNYRPSCATEWMFCQHPNVEPHPNKRHKLIDFYIDEVPFDLKLTVLPKELSPNDSKKDMLNWYYTKQSKEGRWGYNNRIIVAVHNPLNRALSWKGKSQLINIYQHINEYMLEYDCSKMEHSSRINGLVADVVLVEVV